MNAVTLELFAPYNESVAVLGEFNDWQGAAMTKGGDGYFRIELELEDGRYLYRYEVASKSWFYEENEKVMICDPYATEVVDDEHQNGVLEIRDGRKVVGDYQWRNDEVPLPRDHEIVIYEVLVHDFSGVAGDESSRGTFGDVSDRIDYLQDLGINVVELLPVEEYPGEEGWGYNPRHFFAPESSYGTPTELKTMVDALHGAGIRVFKDGVYNHAETSTPLAQIDHDYWFHHDPQDKEQNWGPEFNYTKHDEEHDVMPARKFVGDVVGHWLNEYHLDGIRFDAAAQLDSFDTLSWLAEKGKEFAGEKPFYVVAEYFPEDPRITKPDGPADACWHETFYHTMRSVLCGDGCDVESLMDVIDPRRRGFESGFRVVNYLSNHDHAHLMTDLGNAGIVDEAAFVRSRLGAVVLMTAAGVPLIWAGQEFGDYGEKSSEPRPISWGLLEGDRNKGLFQLYKGLIHLRKTNSALHGKELEFIHVDHGLPLIAWLRWNDEGSRVVTVANFSGQHLGLYTVSEMPVDGRWRDWIHQQDVEVTDGKLVTEIGEWEAKVFVV